MIDEIKKDITEVRAHARGIHVTPRKARLVADLVKGLPVDEAITQLEFSVKKPALPIKKLINSAIANAKHNFQIESDRLFIKNLSVDQGRVFQKFSPRAQGRAFPMRKRTSHINIILGVAKAAFKSRRQLLPLIKKDADAGEKAVTTPVAKSETAEKKSRFAFWKKKKDSDTTQVPPKKDIKGKRYTGFDRRGNMGA
ncbi:MAG: 50S ribosomal protein L22 [bacterium]|nr:50S ribosomal protein L22 [bacterium]